MKRGVLRLPVGDGRRWLVKIRSLTTPSIQWRRRMWQFLICWLEGTQQRVRPFVPQHVGPLSPWVYIDDSYQKARTHSPRPSLACMYRHSLLCLTADMSAVSHRSMSALSRSRHVFCVTQQTCLLCHTADMSAVSPSRHDSCVTETCTPICLCDILQMRIVLSLSSRGLCWLAGAGSIYVGNLFILDNLLM